MSVSVPLTIRMTATLRAVREAARAGDSAALAEAAQAAIAKGHTLDEVTAAQHLGVEDSENVATDGALTRIRRAAASADKAANELRAAILAAHAAGCTMRAIGDAAERSHQRVSQLIAEGENEPPKGRQGRRT